MAQEVVVEADVVALQLGAFERLLTNVDAHFEPIRSAAERQVAGTWTEAGSAAAFGASYSAALTQVETSLRSMRADISAAMETLRKNATDLENRDLENRARFEALAKRLAESPTAPAIVAPYYAGNSEAPATASAPASPDTAASSGSGAVSY